MCLETYVHKSHKNRNVNFFILLKQFEIKPKIDAKRFFISHFMSFEGIEDLYIICPQKQMFAILIHTLEFRKIGFNIIFCLNYAQQKLQTQGSYS